MKSITARVLGARKRRVVLAQIDPRPHIRLESADALAALEALSQRVN